jgi:uncharacterized protein (TIGR02757 family)
MKTAGLKALLDEKYLEYNCPGFIVDDPVYVPHLFTKLQDIEISAFWTAILAWGKRKTIINKAVELFRMMDFSPHEFIIGHKEKDLLPLAKFKHRTFNGDDTLYFIHFLNEYYRAHNSLETAFLKVDGGYDAYSSLAGFHRIFFNNENHLPRTCKHIATPQKNSACKRINMFLRWMVRVDRNGVDFGIWKRIPASQLICPCDVHVNRVAKKLGLITRPKPDWLAAVELTEKLRHFDPADPVKYDYALFGLGLEGY